MQPIPNAICDFLQRQSVLSLACAADGKIWSANCFYIFDEESYRLIILTKADSLHGKLMLANSKVAGTVAVQTAKINEIEGVQFSATACLLQSLEKEAALKRYFSRYPIARLMVSDVWALQLHQLKYTDNRRFFGEKTIWQI